MAEALLVEAGIRLEVPVEDREAAVRACGAVLEELGTIQPEYAEAMWERELIFSSYVGEGVAIPHGTDASRKFVNRAQLVVLRFAEPIDWEGETVRLAVGIASKGNEHVTVLGQLAEVLLDDDYRNLLFESSNKSEIAELLTKVIG